MDKYCKSYMIENGEKRKIARTIIFLLNIKNLNN